MASQPRSTFWVVSTHVLTSGFAIPAVMALISAAIIRSCGFQDAKAILAVGAVCGIAGYVGGTFYSLSYLRKVAEHKRWTDCTAPSIVTCIVLSVLGFTWGLIALPPPQRNAFYMTLQLIVCVIEVWAFGKITQAGFRSMSASGTESCELNNPQPLPQSHGGIKAALFLRARNACIGFSVGFIAGLGIAAYMDKAGWNPPNGWQTRLLTATAVGGIGAFLGLISGTPQRV